MKVLIGLGNTPAECFLEVDGKKVANVTSLEASVSIEDGPSVEYTTIDDTHEIHFDPVIKDSVKITTMGDLKKGKVNG